MSFIATYFSKRERLALVMRAMKHYCECKDVPEDERKYMRGMLRTLNEIVN